MTASDGAKGYYALFDTALGVECGMRPASDGQTRCIPSAGAEVGSFYADAACSTPLAMAPDACASSPGAYALQYLYLGAAGGTSGPWQETVFSLGAAYAGAVYVGTPASCSQDSSPPSYPLYTVGAEVSPSSFVAMTEYAPGAGPVPSASDLPQNGSRIAWETTTTADGAVAPYFAWDSQLSQQCLFEQSGDGQVRCLPYYLGGVYSYFADSSCTSPLFETSSSAAGLDAYAEGISATGCTTGSFYSVGALFSGTAYVGSGSSCSAVTASSSTAYYEVTPFPASGFEAVTSEVGGGPFAGIAGGSRLKLVVATGSDGVRTSTSWYDAQLGVDCDTYTALDGVVRCVPSPLGYVSSYYADSACSEQLIYTAGCTTPSYASSDVSCGGSYYAVGAPYSGTVYYGSGTSCVATTLGLPTYQLGAAVPASAFVDVTLSH